MYIHVIAPQVPHPISTNYHVGSQAKITPRGEMHTACPHLCMVHMYLIYVLTSAMYNTLKLLSALCASLPVCQSAKLSGTT